MKIYYTRDEVGAILSLWAARQTANVITAQRNTFWEMDTMSASGATLVLMDDDWQETKTKAKISELPGLLGLDSDVENI